MQADMRRTRFSCTVKCRFLVKSDPTKWPVNTKLYRDVSVYVSFSVKIAFGIHIPLALYFMFYRNKTESSNRTLQVYLTDVWIDLFRNGADGILRHVSSPSTPAQPEHTKKHRIYCAGVRPRRRLWTSWWGMKPPISKNRKEATYRHRAERS